MNHADDPIVCRLHSVKSSNQQKASHALFKKNICLVCSDRTADRDTFRRVGCNQVAANRADFIEQQHIQVELFSSSVNSLLTSQEALLEVVGYQLAQQSDLPALLLFRFVQY